MLVTGQVAQPQLGSPGGEKEQVATGIASFPTLPHPRRGVEVLNLGLTADYFLERDGDVLVLVPEGPQGDDLNGDGDLADHVVHVARTNGESGFTNLGVAVRFSDHFHSMPPQVLGGVAAFVVGEGFQLAADLNGDGDAEDSVIHFYDFATGSLSNLGLASDGVTDRLLLNEDWLVVAVDEFRQGADLDGDGEMGDDLLFGLDTKAPDPATSVEFLGFTVHANSVGPSLEGDLLAAPFWEQGDVDLNGDGDTADTVPHVRDMASGSTANTGLPIDLGRGPEWFWLENGRLNFVVKETESDLNGDGDVQSNEDVMHLFDAAGAGAIENLGYAALGSSSKYSIDIERDGTRIAYLVSEKLQGNTDLNGDGDAFDRVVRVHDWETGQGRNLGVAGRTLSMFGPHLMIVVPEIEGGSDLNGDGDTSDDVVHVYDFDDDSLHNLQLAVPCGGGRHLQPIENFGQPLWGTANGPELFAFTVDEESHGQDLNGDGDQFDFVVHKYRPGETDAVNLGLATSPTCDSFNNAYLQVERREIVIVVDEQSQGVDLDEDGHETSSLLFLHDDMTGLTSNLRLAVSTTPGSPNAVTHFRSFQRDGDRLYFVADENDGGVDLNGDGDQLDGVLHVAILDGEP